MKIDNGSNLGSIPATGVAGAAGTDAASQRVAGLGVGSASPDSAELSGLAGKISQTLSQDSADRAAKGEQLRALISSGQYSSDSAAVSRGIVNDALTSSAAAGGA
jgi:flagellar biosynthesis anti-sigma factor FlgM